MEQAPFKHLLLATDLSPSAATAGAEALRLAARWNAKLTVAYVNTDLPLSRRWFGLKNGEAVEEAVRSSGRQKIEELARDMASASGLAVDWIALEGHEPAEAIVNYVAASGADVLLVGTHGTTAADVFGLGSVAVQLIRTSPVPVLTVKPDKEPGFQDILAPVDFTPSGEVGLAAAIGAARQAAGATLHILHAFEPLGFASISVVSPAEMDAYRDAAVAHEREQLDALLARYDLSGLDVKIEVSCLTPARAILGYVEEHGIDLICMGTVGRTGLAGLVFGNTAEQILRGVTCSVLTVHPSGEGA